MNMFILGQKANTLTNKDKTRNAIFINMILKKTIIPLCLLGQTDKAGLKRIELCYNYFILEFQANFCIHKLAYLHLRKISRT